MNETGYVPVPPEALPRPLCADCEVAERFANRDLDAANERTDKAIDVAHQYAEENIGLKRQLAELRMELETAQAKTEELRGICENAIGHIEAAKANGWEIPGVRYGLVKCEGIDAALNELTRSR